MYVCYTLFCVSFHIFEFPCSFLNNIPPSQSSLTLFIYANPLSLILVTVLFVSVNYNYLVHGIVPLWIFKLIFLFFNMVSLFVLQSISDNSNILSFCEPVSVVLFLLIFCMLPFFLVYFVAFYSKLLISSQIYLNHRIKLHFCKRGFSICFTGVQGRYQSRTICN